jgi:hypothetical protein
MTDAAAPAPLAPAFAALTVKIFSVYMMILGCCMMLVPVLIFSLVQLPLGDGVPFVRSLGMVVFLFGTQYWVAGANRTLSFIRVSVGTRLGAVGILVLMTALGWVDWKIAAFALLDGAGGLWTWWALRRGV